MEIMKLDVVYFCRPGDNEELRYSIRSVVANFPYNRIIIYGGKPDYIQPDIYRQITQHGATAYHAVRNMIRQACADEEITPEFWLFNDDFFIMKPIANLKPQYNGTLADHIRTVELKQYGPTPYTEKLRHLYRTLYQTRPAGGFLDYAVHKPMKINRAKARAVMDAYPYEPMFRALYGNIYNLGGENGPDCKFGSAVGDPKAKDLEIISTSDEAFTGGDIGQYIRAKFPEPSRYENG